MCSSARRTHPRNIRSSACAVKAFLLAAGIGSRLRPLTDRVPKCLVPVAGEPLLERWFRELLRVGVKDVLVNTHHLAEAVQRYVQTRPDDGLVVHLAHEPRLLGSAGTVREHRGFVQGEKAFFIVYADNLTDVRLDHMLAFHRDRGSRFTMGVFDTSEPGECGIATLDRDGRVISFVEKPRQPQGSLANAGLYISDPTIVDAIPDRTPTDFGHDVLPGLVGHMYGYPIRGFFRDLGTPERLESARAHWAGRVRVRP